ncbi:MAG: type II secretion system F family protein [Verrucomicrobiales bacterium]|nr:type II secretion system F family protein [Verrucomicrobiales bacterium]
MSGPDLPAAVPTLLMALLWIVPVVLFGVIAYALISLPHRRLERARFFLDLVAAGLARGRTPEHTIQELARLRDPELGVRFHLLAAHLEMGLGLEAALERVPALLPPQVRAALQGGIEAGRLPEAIPACQAMLKDAPAQTQHLLHYLILLFTGFTPTLLTVLLTLQVFVLPKFALLMDEMGDGVIGPPDFKYLKLATLLGVVLLVVNLVILLGVILHLGGPHLRRWFNRWLPPIPDFLAFLIPWKRQRMLRDFTGSLALLLDAQVSEERALKLAADTTANRCYQRRAQQGMADLREGRGLVRALTGFDPSGELRWRIANALRGGQPFVIALNGWREALQARAFRAEQSAAHGITSALILLNGLLVALVVLSLFGMLVQLIEAATLW